MMRVFAVGLIVVASIVLAFWLVSTVIGLAIFSVLALVLFVPAGLLLFLLIRFRLGKIRRRSNKN